MYMIRTPLLLWNMCKNCFSLLTIVIHYHSMKRNTIRDESSLGADATTTTTKWMYSSIPAVFRLDAKFHACCSVSLIVISRQERPHRRQDTDATTAPNEGWSCGERAPSRSFTVIEKQGHL